MLRLAPENHWHKKASEVSLTEPIFLGSLWVALALGRLRPNPAVVGPRRSEAKSSFPRLRLQNSNSLGESLRTQRMGPHGTTHCCVQFCALRGVEFLNHCSSSRFPGGPCEVPRTRAARQALGKERGEWPWGPVPGKATASRESLSFSSRILPG